MEMHPSTEIIEEEDRSSLDVAGSITEAFTTIGEGVVGLVSSFDVLGIGLISEDQQAISEEIGADTSVYQHIATYFTIFSAFAYLLFVLMYFPCLAVIGAARQEMGGFYAGVMAAYSTLLAWAVATLFYQIAEGHNLWFIALSLLILAGIYGGLHLLGKREKMVSNIVFAPPIRKSCCE
jgi:ferrous iron transport protein B